MPSVYSLMSHTIGRNPKSRKQFISFSGAHTTHIANNP